jgi:hypothetical protein
MIPCLRIMDPTSHFRIALETSAMEGVRLTAAFGFTGPAGFTTE